jgi:hypothetical protein
VNILRECSRITSSNPPVAGAGPGLAPVEVGDAVPINTITKTVKYAKAAAMMGLVKYRLMRNPPRFSQVGSAEAASPDRRVEGARSLLAAIDQRLWGLFQ